MPGSLRSNFSWTLAGNLVYAACQWLLVVMIAKLGSAELVGRFMLAVAVCSPLMVAAGLALRVVQASDVGQTRPFGLYFGLRITTTTLALIAILVVTAIGYRDAALVIALYAAAKSVEALSEVVWGELQQREQMARIARSMVMKGVLAIGGVALALGLTHDLVTAVIALAIAWLVTFLAYDLVVAKRLVGSLRPTLQGAFALARTAFPLGLVTMIGAYATNAPRYFVEHHGGERELGLFSAIANLMLVGSTLMTALGQAALPRLSRAFLDRDRETLDQLTRLLVGVAVALGLAGLLVALIAGRFALDLIYTSEYALHSDVLVVIMLTGLAANVAASFGVIVTASGDYQRQVGLQVINLIVVTVAAWWLVPRLGALGAAWALCAANTVTAITFGALAIARIRTYRPRRSDRP
ncbi:MAG: oligosaccharide flippase family protein [Kofleriaceae bacterium]